MAKVYRLRSRYSLYLCGIVRDADSSSIDVQQALLALGTEIGRFIIEEFFLEPKTVVTPMNERADVLTLASAGTVVLTTRSDLQTFGAAIATVAAPSWLGYMNFEGRRGLEALTTPVRDAELPTPNVPITNVIVGKSTLATGCTAISLTRTALEVYNPARLFIATLFYSLEGLHELSSEFEDATIICVGEPDSLDEHGMLHPGIGLLDERIK